MLHAVRSMLGHAESIRAAVAIGPPRGNVAAVVRSEYERMAVLAARAGDAALVLEIVERLRTELLAGLLRTGTQALPDDLRSLLTQIEETNTALVSATAGVRSRFTTPTVGAIAHPPTVELAERLRELHSRLSRRTNSLFAAACGAVPVAWDDILGIGSDVLALLPLLDGDTPRILAVWRSTEGAGAVTLSDLDPGLVALRDVLGRPGAAGIVARCNLTSSDLDSVRHLLPPAFIKALRRGRRPTKLTVVPSGWLWAVPFAGVPLDGDASVLLVDVADIALTLSLRFAVERGTRRADAPAAPGLVVVWAAPDAGIAAPEIAAPAAHGAGFVELADADAVRDTLVDGGRRFRTAVVSAHGNREPGLAQGVLDRGRVVLRAADYLDGTKVPPPLLSLAACHSGYPDGDNPQEPLGLAIAARTSGVDQVLSSTFELDSRPGPATDCLADLYTALGQTDDMPAALAAAQRACRSTWREQADPLYRWAVLAVVGYHDDGRWRT